MIFNPDLSKQVQEIIFSEKAIKISHSNTTFNTVPIANMPKPYWSAS